MEAVAMVTTDILQGFGGGESVVAVFSLSGAIERNSQFHHLYYSTDGIVFYR